MKIFGKKIVILWIKSFILNVNYIRLMRNITNYHRNLMAKNVVFREYMKKRGYNRKNKNIVL